MKPETLDERLRALSHPVRRALFLQCLGEDRTAGDLVESADLAPASVSEHLKVLRKSGLLVLRREGRFRRYRADPDAVRGVSKALARLVESENLPAQPGDRQE